MQPGSKTKIKILKKKNKQRIKRDPSLRNIIRIAAKDHI